MSKVYRRRRWNDDDPRFVLPAPDPEPGGPATTADPERDEGLPPDARWANWADADVRGPLPPPDWLLTDGDAVDHDRGVIKTGKEADVHLVERITPDGRSLLLACKRYRDREHRLFHRDAAYLDGRRVRRSREMRAMANRTEIGREMIAGQWAVAEHRALAQLWLLGLPVPYPVQLDGTALTLEFVGTDDGTAAPRLAQLRPDPAALTALWLDLWASLRALAEAGYAHGDLSAYNLLVHDERVWLIDLPPDRRRRRERPRRGVPAPRHGERVRLVLGARAAPRCRRTGRRAAGARPTLTVRPLPSPPRPRRRGDR